jgi:hypothetical protein
LILNPPNTNLRGRVIVVRTGIHFIIILVITASAAVTALFTRIFFVVIGVFVILSFGRRFRSLDTFPSRLFLNLFYTIRIENN